MLLEEIKVCFQGIYPSSFYSCSREGIPNVNYISHVHMVDSQHVAISGQFLNKSRKNLEANPCASVQVIDPNTLCHYELELNWKRSETSGEVFKKVNDRLEAIHSQIGSDGRWKLASIELFEVKAIRIPPEYADYHLKKKPKVSFSLQSFQLAISEIQKATSLEALYDKILETLETTFGFRHSMLLVPEGKTNHLITITSRGYEDTGVGSEVKVGEGIIGKVALLKKPLAFMGLRREMIYAHTALDRAIELPRLTKALSQIAIPLLSRDELMGVLQVECVDTFDLTESDEEFLMTFGSYLALVIENFQMQQGPEGQIPKASATKPLATADRNIHVTYYQEDECVFIDGEYLIRNIPAKVLWKILSSYQNKEQVEFSNRELRLDPFLKLPDFKDNLETRLILLRKRLEKKCPAISIESSGRGKFKLSVHGKLTLEEL